MGTHKFRVGQLVDFSPSQQGICASGSRYKILGLLPQEDGEALYRIKTIAEQLVRVAMEGELTLGLAVRNSGRVLQFGDPGARRASLAAPV